MHDNTKIINHDLYQNDIKAIYRNYTDHKRQKSIACSYLLVYHECSTSIILINQDKFQF